MENNNFSIGTYSISTDGMSINYSTPSYLPKETMEKMVMDNSPNEGIEIDKKGASFDDILKGVLSVPKP